MSDRVSLLEPFSCPLVVLRSKRKALCLLCAEGEVEKGTSTVSFTAESIELPVDVVVVDAVDAVDAVAAFSSLPFPSQFFNSFSALSLRAFTPTHRHRGALTEMATVDAT